MSRKGLMVGLIRPPCLAIAVPPQVGKRRPVNESDQRKLSAVSVYSSEAGEKFRYCETRIIPLTA
jgi:hypothetical protein